MSEFGFEEKGVQTMINKIGDAIKKQTTDTETMSKCCNAYKKRVDDNVSEAAKKHVKDAIRFLNELVEKMSEKNIVLDDAKRIFDILENTDNMDN